MLKHSPAKILSIWLQNKQLVAEFPNSSWYCYVGYLPEQFHNTLDVHRNAVCVTDSGDESQGRWLRKGDQFLRYTVQIRSRGLEYLQAWEVIKKIDIELSHIVSETVKVDDYFYTIKSISRTSGVIPMGIDPGQQTFNFSLNISGIFEMLEAIK